MVKNNNLQQRIEYIDICKALAIFAMVFCHIGLRLSSSNADLARWIHLWHMPIFFILSGLVLNPLKWLGWDKYQKFAVSRFKSILIPYLFWGFICNCYLYIVSNYLMKSSNALTLNDFVCTSFDFNTDTISAFRWFLPAIFLTEIIFVAVSNIIGIKKYLAPLYIMVAIWGGYLVEYKLMPTVPFALNVIPFTLGFYAVGFLFKDYILRFSFRHKVTIFFIGAFICIWYFCPIDVNVRTSYYHPLYLSWFLCIAICLSIIFIVKYFEGFIMSSILFSSIRFLGRNTLLIYLLHYEVLRIIPWKIFVIENSFELTIMQAVSTFGVLFVLSFAIRFINKYLAWSLGKF